MPNWNRGLLALAVVVAALGEHQVRADALDRLTAERLEAIHQAVLKLRGERRNVDRCGPLKEFRANMHVHSAFSHDSREKID